MAVKGLNTNILYNVYLFLFIDFLDIHCFTLLPPSQNRASTKQSIPCPDSLCEDRGNGNFAMESHPNYFLQCAHGQAYCLPCFPTSLLFGEICKHCLKSEQKCLTSRLLSKKAIRSGNKLAVGILDPCPQVCQNVEVGIKRNPLNPNQFVYCRSELPLACDNCPIGEIYGERWQCCYNPEDLEKTKRS